MEKPLTPLGAQVRFLVDVIDIDETTGQRYVAARAGDVGVVTTRATGPSDWPTVTLATGGMVIADLDNPKEVEIVT